MRYKLAIVCLLISSFAAGCSYVSLPSLPWSSAAVQPDPTAEALLEEGMAYLNNKKYALAIDRFQRVKAEFPFTPQLIPAELKLAEAYYFNKQYPEAATAFKEFQTLHPTNENIPMAVFYLGLSYFDQFTSVERDQKMTRIAKGYFETVVKNHPSSPYASQAKEKLAKCLEYLAEHEFNIAAFYLREQKYPAARERLEEILRRYKDAPMAAKSLYHLGESYRREKNSVKAALAYEALIQHYPENPLAKEARTQLGQLEKEKQDPLALLLMRDRRPATTSPSTALAQRPEGGEIENRKSKIENLEELNLVVKKEVVYEQPGDEKGMFSRVMDTLNPFASSSEKKGNGDKKIAPAKEKEVESDGFFASLWRGLNPFAKEEKGKPEAPRDSQLVGKVDESLKKQGVQTGPEPLVLQPPAADLPQTEQPASPPADTRELLGRIDSNLKKEGKNVTELPPVPEIHPVLQASGAKDTEMTSAKGETSPSPAASGLLTGIDAALKRKGIEPPKVEMTSKPGAQRVEGQPATLKPSSVSGQKKIELDPRLTHEKGPLFLDTPEYQGQEKPKEGQAGERLQPPAKSPEPGKELPQAVVKGAQPIREKPAETKVTERRKSPEEAEESKSALDQLREDLGRIRNLLNPFGW